MHMTHRAYCEEAGDFRRLCRFVIDHNAQVRAQSTWSLGRLVDWKYGLYGNKTAAPAFCDRNAHLWFDAFDDLAGFVVSEDGAADFAILTLEGYQWLYPELLAWVQASWQARGPAFSTEITARQALAARALDAAGFRRTGTFYTRCFDLAAEPAPRSRLAPGFTIVDMATHPDYRAQRILRDDAFQGGAVPPEAELQRELLFYNHTHAGPLYHAACDLCVRAPDGRLVAGCEALLDAHNAEAEIERVCTHSAFRRRGFARAVIQECLARLRDMGLRRAYLTGYSPAALALYGSLGAVAETQAFIYARGESAPG